MATKKQAATEDGTVKARVIFDGRFGKVNDVVELDRADAAAGASMGDLDTHPEAVAYAESLKG
jgi:hypothetical protein